MGVKIKIHGKGFVHKTLSRDRKSNYFSPFLFFSLRYIFCDANEIILKRNA